LKMADIMSLAYQLAVSYGIKKQYFFQEKWKAWKEVVEKFPKFSSRNFSDKTWSSSLSGARGFTPESVAQYFYIYEPAIRTIQHNHSGPYNCDETDIATVQHKHTKVLRLTGKRQISSVQSAERRSLVTVVNRVSPTGQFIPPLLVFLRKFMKP
jgi:hypothetical protein